MAADLADFLAAMTREGGDPVFILLLGSFFLFGLLFGAVAVMSGHGFRGSYQTR